MRRQLDLYADVVMNVLAQNPSRWNSKEEMQSLLTKRNLKKAYKEIALWREEINFPGLLHFGHVCDTETGSSGRNYFILKNEEAIAKLAGYIDLKGVKPTPSAYDCTGRYMSSQVRIYPIRNGHIAVVQSWGYDV